MHAFRIDRDCKLTDQPSAFRRHDAAPAWAQRHKRVFDIDITLCPLFRQDFKDPAGNRRSIVQAFASLPREIHASRNTRRCQGSVSRPS
jgi:hypothetical protein